MKQAKGLENKPDASSHAHSGTFAQAIDLLAAYEYGTFIRFEQASE
jgi:hypothetical protein